MGAYEYQAIDNRGRTRKGVSSGDSARQIRQTLREQGLIPLAVVGVGDTSPQSVQQEPSRSRARIKIAELAVVTRQFATLLGSGLTVEEALTALIEQAEAHQTKSVLTGVRAMVLEGNSLAEAVSAYPRSFSEIYRATVEAGEQSGRLDSVLSRLADHTENRLGIQQRVGLAMVYPVILTVLSLIIVTGLLTYVVPKVVAVFEDIGQELPLLTQMLIGISDFLLAHGLWVMGGILVVTAIAMLALRRFEVRYRLHGLWLRLPLVRRLTRSLNSARMARTLAIMVGSGVPLLSAMRSSEGVMTNLVLRRDLSRAAQEVAEGVSISRSLARGGRFPPLLVQMVSSGEASGLLGEMLDTAANVMERELEARIGVLVGLFQPAMILVMGAVVLIIVLAILLPIFDLNQLIQ